MPILKSLIFTAVPAYAHDPVADQAPVVGRRAGRAAGAGEAGWRAKGQEGRLSLLEEKRRRSPCRAICDGLTPALKAARTAFIFEGVKVTRPTSTCPLSENVFLASCREASARRPQ
ncbi:MAG: hypothetical protein P8Y71_30130, partial [Pseudolabrys sp.]